MIDKKIVLKILVIIFLILLPWFNGGNFTNENIPEIRQESNPFYEINPCKVSLFQYFSADIKSIYQDHYFFRPNNKSSISCFGKITGIAVQQKNLETNFIISIGTNSFINLFYQSSIWLLLLSFLKRNKSEVSRNRKILIVQNVSILLVTYLQTFSIYAEKRFYESSFFIFDFQDRNSYILVFLIFYFINKNLTNIYLSRSDNLLNYIPFLFVISGIISGYNLIIFSSIFLFVGFNSIFFNKIPKIKYLYLYISLSIWWLFNSNGSFYFKPGKLRGFTNSVYEFNSNLFWIIFFGVLVVGLISELDKFKEKFELSTFSNNFSISAFIILLIGLVSSHFPALNFFSYYYLGLQRNVVEQLNPFAFDEFGVKVSWRGISPSSELIGEFFALCLLVSLFDIYKKNKIEIYNYIGVVSAGLGLYFSDNRTSIYLTFIFICYYLYSKNSDIVNISKKRIFILFLIILVIFYLFQIFLPDTFKFYGESILSKANNYQYDSIYSSFLSYLIESYEKKNFVFQIFSFFSVIGLFLNRSEMWGIFFSRYNPTFLELYFGSGPLTLGQLYGETYIVETASLLLPHSSFLSYIVYFGLIPIVFLLYKYIKYLFSKSINYEFLILSIFMIINIFKNDSLNYFSAFVLYFFLLYLSKINKFSS